MGSRVALLGENPLPELVRHLSLELQVTKDTPPAFIVQGEEDRTVPVENSLMFYQALRKAGVPAELHLYAKGPHGFGMTPGHGAISDWPRLCETSAAGERLVAVARAFGCAKDADAGTEFIEEIVPGLNSFTLRACPARIRVG